MFFKPVIVSPPLISLLAWYFIQETAIEAKGKINTVFDNRVARRVTMLPVIIKIYLVKVAAKIN